jgi:hypothetical protein
METTDRKVVNYLSSAFSAYLSMWSRFFENHLSWLTDESGISRTPIQFDRNVSFSTAFRSD